MHVYKDRFFLDIDDMESYGPETITLNNLDSGTYKFYVHDYSSSNSRRSKRLSYSNATVRLYRENELLETFIVPYGEAGTLWNVFEIHGRTGRIEEIKTLKYVRDFENPR